MKAVRTVTELRETEYKGSEKPKFKNGEYVRVYCGREEGHHFYIKETRYNHDTYQFEHLYAPYAWYGEKSLVSGSSRKGWHYDSQGYCDNPGRGY